MKLLPSRKNEIVNKIQLLGLSPLRFDFIDNMPPEVCYYEIVYKDNTDYRFKFVKDSISFDLLTYTPGNSLYTKSFWFENDFDTYYETNFIESLKFIDEWLQNLKIEIREEEIWKKYQYQAEHFGTESQSSDNSKFSAQEFQLLQTKLADFKKSIGKLNLLPEQVQQIEQKVDSIHGLAVDLGKFDWLNLFIGTIMSIIIQLNVNKENAEAIWQIVNNFFSDNHLLG